MSWMTRLYETYERAQDLNLKDDKKPCPICHTLQNAHIKIILDEQGNFQDAEVFEKKQIVLPVTEQSAGRTSGEAPHPLSDRLQYVAKDYAEYGGTKNAYFASYAEQLKKWCDSEFTNSKIQAVYQYIIKGTVIRDLIDIGIIHSHDRIILEKWTDEKNTENKPLLYKVLKTYRVGDALIAWSVDILGDRNPNTWEDQQIQKSWISYVVSTQGKSSRCYVTGEVKPLAITHPARLRHTGDMAKLISANDNSGFTFRGKFIENSQACGISFDVSQKAHSALSWLITRQAYRNDDQVVVAWAISGQDLPAIFPDSHSDTDFSGLSEINDNEESQNTDHDIRDLGDMGQLYSNQLTKRIAGYAVKIPKTDNVIVMALDSASPGRMSITYYREYLAPEFFERIKSWYADFAWLQQYSAKVEGSKTKTKIIRRIGVPLIKDIIDAAYGRNVAKNLKRNLVERLLPCILEVKQIPFDIVNSCVMRAVNPNCSTNWEWRRNIGIACSLYKGYYKRHPDIKQQKEYSMALDLERNTRDYLYGRLLAVAESIEQMALSGKDKNRATNAERLMLRFASRPFSTWEMLEKSLRPYINQLQAPTSKGFLISRQNLLDNLISQISTLYLTDDSKLQGEFLLGYHCQREELFKGAPKKDDQAIDSPSNETNL